MKKRKTNFVTWGVLFMFLMVPFQFGCEKGTGLIPEEEQISVTENENSSRTKGTLSNRRVKLYYDESGFRSSATTALKGALQSFNSTFGTNFYYQSRSYWSHSGDKGYNGDFKDVTNAHGHLQKKYPHNDYFAVAGASGKIYSVAHGNLGIQSGSHFVIDWDRLGTSAKRKSCFLHEFTHNIPGCGNIPGNGSQCGSSTCVMTSNGVKNGSTSYCIYCNAKVILGLKKCN